MEDLKNYLAVKYPKTKGKTLASWQTSPLSMSIGVYEGEDLVEGLILLNDPKRDYKWVLLDNFHADLATRNYIEFITEFEDAISFFDEVETLFENEEENEDDLFDETLD
jgi:hypothetical protein